MARTLHSRIASSVSSMSTGATDRDPSRSPARSARVAGSGGADDSSDDDGGGTSAAGAEEGGRSPAGMLKALLASREEEMYIELAEPHRTYGPGDLVRGQVILSLTKPTKTLYASIKFSGQVVIHLNKSRSKEYLFRDYLVFRGTTTDGRIQPGAQITTDGADKDVRIPSRVERKLWQVETMPAGRHVFEFEFQMPSPSLPSTVDFGRGSIVYTLRCDHQKPRALLGRSRNTARKDISVIDAIDVAQFAEPRRRTVDFDQRGKRREGTGKIEATVDVSRYGYLKGETITPVIRVTHYRPIKNLQGAIVTLCRMSRFDSPDMAPQTFRKDLAQNVTPLLVDPQTLEYKVSPRVRIPPDAFPTIRQAGPVSFRYYVEVMLDLNSKATVFQVAPTDAAATYTGDGGNVMIETEALRRERGVYRVQFEVIIGTRDSRGGGGGGGGGWTEPTPTRSTHSNSHQSDGRASSQSHSRTGTDVHSLPPSIGATPTAAGFPLSKQDLLRREQALLPSEPPPDDGEGEGDDEPVQYVYDHADDVEAELTRPAHPGQQHARYTTRARARSYSGTMLPSPLAAPSDRPLRPSEPPGDGDDGDEYDRGYSHDGIGVGVDVGEGASGGRSESIGAFDHHGQLRNRPHATSAPTIVLSPVPQPSTPDVVTLLRNVSPDNALPTYARR